jgi:hypothetical protein
VDTAHFEDLAPQTLTKTRLLHNKSNWFFQNHSDTPNLDVEVVGSRDFKYFTNRDIKKGEELFEDYTDYGDWNGKSS